MSEMPDLSALFSMLSNNNGENKNIVPEEMLMALMNSSSNNSNNNSGANDSETSHGSNSTNQSDFKGSGSSSNNFTSGQSDGMPDMETIMKIMKVIRASNQDSPSKELLKSLKPFLNDSRKEKVDQYIKILGITKVFEIFNELGDKQK